MNKIILTILVCVASCIAQAQNINKISTRCKPPNSSVFASILVNSNGDIINTPCPTRIINYPVGGIKILDVNAVPTIPTATTYILFKGNITNNVQFLTAENTELTITQNVNNPLMFGQYNFYTVSGPYTGGNITGSFTQVSNRNSPSSLTATITSVTGSTSIDSVASAGYGGDFDAFSGGSGGSTTPLLVGVRGVGATHNSIHAVVIGGEFELRNGLGGNGTSTIGSAIHSKINNIGDTVTDARGISFDGWTNGGTITKSSVIFADTSVDIGTTKYFINSTSTSPSNIAGDVAITNNAKGFILKSPDGNCHRLVVDNAGALTTSPVTCP